MAKKRIVITGGAGFIGSHVTKLFCDEGFETVVVDDLSFGYKKFVDPRAQFVKGRIQDSELMGQVLKGTSGVIHLAATSIIKLSIEDPLGCFENNLIGGVKLLGAMRKQGVKKLVFSSTAAVYGDPKRIPVKEDDEKHPKSPYGASKLAFEKALETYYQSYGIESVSLRYFNAYGPQDEQTPATRAVPIWTKALFSGDPIPLYWEGKQVRDYVFVEDIARAHLKALELSGLHFINLGSGKGVVMKDLLQLLEKLTKKKAEIGDTGERLGDPHELVADIKRAKELLGWEPKTPLEEGLKRTIAYYKGDLR